MSKKASVIRVELANGENFTLPASAKKSLYRYLPPPGYTDFSETNIRDILLGNKIRMTGPSEINDPSDCNPDYVDDLRGNKAAKYIRDTVDKNSEIPEFRYLQSELRLRNPNRQARRKNKQDQLFFSEQFKLAILSHYKSQGFISFTENPNSMLMWSHYAASHAGLMFEFKTRPTNTDNFITDIPTAGYCFPMNYRERRPKIIASEAGLSLNKLDFTKSDWILNAILSKSKDWEYEKEWRYIGGPFANRANPRVNTYIQLGNAPVTSITFGLKVSDDTKEYIKNLISEMPYKPKLKQASLSKYSYALKSSIIR